MLVSIYSESWTYRCLLVSLLYEYNIESLLPPPYLTLTSDFWTMFLHTCLFDSAVSNTLTVGWRLKFAQRWSRRQFDIMDKFAIHVFLRQIHRLQYINVMLSNVRSVLISNCSLVPALRYLDNDFPRNHEHIKNENLIGTSGNVKLYSSNSFFNNLWIFTELLTQSRYFMNCPRISIWYHDTSDHRHLGQKLFGPHFGTLRSIYQDTSDRTIYQDTSDHV